MLTHRDTNRGYISVTTVLSHTTRAFVHSVFWTLMHGLHILKMPNAERVIDVLCKAQHVWALLRKPGNVSITVVWLRD